MPGVEALASGIIIYDVRPEPDMLMALAHRLALNGHRIKDDDGRASRCPGPG
jgi:hypothetical protein